MYVVIVNEPSDTSEQLQLGDKIAAAVREAAPEVPIEIRQGDNTDKKLRVKCFGEFEVFLKDKPLAFKRIRTKELFAVLVCHRGSMLSMGTVMSILWEDGDDTDADRSYLRNMIADLKSTLTKAGIGDVIIKKYNSIGINTSFLDCDYYDFLEGKVDAVMSYNGRFMEQYSWAESELEKV